LPFLRRPRRRFVTTAAAVAAVLVVALAGSLLMQVTKGPNTERPTASESASPNGTQAASAPASVARTTVVWFPGFGPGSQSNQVLAEADFVIRYNATNRDNINLQLSLISNDLDNSLLVQQADVVGPVDIQSPANVPTSLLGLNDEIARNKTDLTAYPPALLGTFKDSAGQYDALPYVEYPAFIFYNRDLFKTAGLPDLPTQVGEKYMGADWTWDELATIARRLTLDAWGKNSTEAGFNASRIKDLAWAWAINSFGPVDASGNPISSRAPAYKHWNMGILPSNGGVTTDPIDTYTFVLNKNSKNPDSAFKAMLAIMSDPTLMSYGGMAANPSLQPAYFQTAQATVDKQFTNNPISWSVLTEMAKYAGSPPFDAPMPNYFKAATDDQALYTELQSKGGLNLDSEIAKFKAKLQADFNSTG
jgi:multiple sugar transport system substrate-binding protein